MVHLGRVLGVMACVVAWTGAEKYRNNYGVRRTGDDAVWKRDLHKTEGIAERYMTVGGLFQLSTEDRAGRLIPNERGFLQALAFSCAVEGVNSDDALMPDTRLRYNLQNTGGTNPYEGISAAFELYDWDVEYIVGGHTSAVTRQALRVFSHEKYHPVVSFGTTSTSLTDMVKYPMFLRTVPSEKVLLEALFKFIRGMSWGVVGGVFHDDIDGTATMNLFTDTAKENGIRTTCVRSMTRKASSEAMGKLADCLADTGIQVLVLGVDESVALKMIRRFSLRNDMTGIVFFGMDHLAKLDLNSIGAEERLGDAFQRSFVKGSLTITPTIGNVDSIRQCIQSKNAESVASLNVISSKWRTFWETKFRCTMATNETGVSFAPCPPNVEKRSHDRKCFCTGNERLKTIDPKSGYIADAVRSIAHALTVIEKNCTAIKSQDIDWCSRKHFFPKELVQVAREIPFMGHTGRVSFRGSERKENSFEIHQYNGASKWSRVAQLTFTDTWKIKTVEPDRFRWKHGRLPSTEFVPYDLPNSPAWLWPTIMLVLCVMGIVATVLFMVFFTVKRKSDMVVDTKFSFVVITLMGICMSYASILLESLAINSTICAMRPLFWSFGPVIMIGPSLAKLYSLWKLVHKKTTRTRIEEGELATFLVTLMAFPIIEQTTMFVFGGEQTYAIGKGPEGEDFSFMTCKSSVGVLLEIARGVQTAYLICLLFLGSLASFLTRKYQTYISEIKHIAYSIYTFLVCLVLSIPWVDRIVSSKNDMLQSFLVRCMPAWFATTFLLLAIFVPKFRAIYRPAHSSKKAKGGTGVVFVESPQMKRKKMANTKPAPPLNSLKHRLVAKLRQ